MNHVFKTHFSNKFQCRLDDRQFVKPSVNKIGTKIKMRTIIRLLEYAVQLQLDLIISKVQYFYLCLLFFPSNSMVLVIEFIVCFLLKCFVS